jgi:hypothetical protein
VQAWGLAGAPAGGPPVQGPGAGIIGWSESLRVAKRTRAQPVGGGATEGASGPRPGLARGRPRAGNKGMERHLPIPLCVHPESESTGHIEVPIEAD